MTIKLNRNFISTERVLFQFVEIANGFESMIFDFDWSLANAESQYDESSAKKKAITRSTTWQNVKTRKTCQVQDEKYFKQNW